MNQVGAYLKAEREKKGLSHEQIYEMTRISPDILKKIEEGKVLSSQIFLKSFIKVYAQALGLEPEPLLKEWEETKLPQKSQTKKKRVSSHKNFRFFAMALIVLGIFLFLSSFFKFQKKEEAVALKENPKSQLFPFSQFHKEVLLFPKEDLKIYFKVDRGRTITKTLVAKNWYVIKGQEEIYLRADDFLFMDLIFNGNWMELKTPFEKTFK